MNENEASDIETLELFFNQFGEFDIYTQILFEELFKALMQEKE